MIGGFFYAETFVSILGRRLAISLWCEIRRKAMQHVVDIDCGVLRFSALVCL